MHLWIGIIAASLLNIFNSMGLIINLIHVLVHVVVVFHRSLNLIGFKAMYSREEKAP